MNEKALAAAQEIGRTEHLGESFVRNAAVVIEKMIHHGGKLDPSILDEIMAERDRQDAQWGGLGHDDTHNPGDWMGFVGDQVEKFAMNLIKRQEAYFETPDCRQRLVKVAALAIATLQSMNRKAGGR